MNHVTVMLPLTEQLSLVAETYSAATKVALGTLGDKLLNGGGRFRKIAAGGDLNTKSFERVMQWFSDNWPEGTEWPEGVVRPQASIQDGAAA